ncbi:MAG: SDR family NAD(P)-dependent oxidoreductase [Flavimaricola sp.]|nr:SDR family NAD(P)-dependent oxidoreductase [Flavimaricola sp.]
MSDQMLTKGRTAVITGAASGIGRAAALRLAARGMNIVLADVAPELDATAADVAKVALGGVDAVMSVRTDVAKPADLEALAAATYDRFGDCALLMNNAAVRVKGGQDESMDDWYRTMDVNFWGPVHGERAFLPRMQAAGKEAVVINTGSKQGITNPPGNVIYNVTKSALKTYTEQLEHRLRSEPGPRIAAYLLVPGWTTTGKDLPKPGAWSADQVAVFMLDAIAEGQFYIICPDDDVTTEMDNRRILWGAGDLAEKRPPLSRWHADWKDKFQ